jgi:hypothetical protein
MMTVEAIVKLIPKPPALVPNKKTNMSTSGFENLSIAACLSDLFTLPSNLTKGYPAINVNKKSKNRNFTFVIHVIFQNIQQFHHLTENQNTLLLFSQTSQ